MIFSNTVPEFNIHLMKILKITYSIFILLSILLISFYGCKKTEKLNSATVFEIPSRIDTIIKKRIENNFENKVYLAKISLNKPTEYEFYSDKKNQSQSNKDRFEIGSITKTFTSLVIYKLYKKGLISYEDKIVTYLPDSLANTKGINQIQIKHLLNHTSGLPWFPEHYEITTEPWNNPFKNFNTNHLMGYIKSFNFPQKREFQYSNLGYGLLTFIIEDITNRTISESINELIIENLKTDWDIKEKTTITGFDWNRAFNNWDFPSINFGVGGLRGNIENIAAYGVYMLELINSDTKYLDLIFSDTIKFEQPFYHLAGKGWYKKINKANNQEFIFHGGWTGGFNSYIILDIKEKEGLIILSNTASFIDDIAINYFDSTFAIRQSMKDFSWILSEELKEETDIQTALYSIDRKEININRLLEFSRFISSENLEKSIAINNFIIELEPTNWVAIFEQGKYYASLKKYKKAKILFRNAIKTGGNIPIIEKHLNEVEQK